MLVLLLRVCPSPGATTGTPRRARGLFTLLAIEKTVEGRDNHYFIDCRIYPKLFWGFFHMYFIILISPPSVVHLQTRCPGGDRGQPAAGHRRPADGDQQPDECRHHRRPPVLRLRPGGTNRPFVCLTDSFLRFSQIKFKNIFSNISDIYRHLRNNRESIRKKCSKKKCERLVDNVNNLKTSVNFIKDANITILEEMVDLLKNSSTAGYEDLHRIN